MPGWNLVGNPFPSYIRINSKADPIGLATDYFLGVNRGVLPFDYIAAYYWDPTAISNAGAYGVINNASTGFVHLAPGQGFFVRVAADESEISFPLTLRTHSATAFKSTEEWPEITLKVSNQGYQESTRIKFIPEMTPGLDPGYDAGLFDLGGPMTIATRLVEDTGTDFMLQCLPDQDQGSVMIPVMLRAPRGSSLSFSLNASGLQPGIKVYLEDRLLGRFTRLDEEGALYAVTLSEKADGPGRFYLHTSRVDIVPDAGYSDLFTIIPIPAQGKIRIIGPVSHPARATVVDLAGRALTTALLKDASDNELTFRTHNSGLYLLVIESDQPTVHRKIAWVMGN
jgi:hypothetical protein